METAVRLTVMVFGVYVLVGLVFGVWFVASRPAIFFSAGFQWGRMRSAALMVGAVWPLSMPAIIMGDRASAAREPLYSGVSTRFRSGEINHEQYMEEIEQIRKGHDAQGPDPEGLRRLAEAEPIKLPPIGKRPTILK